MRGRRILTLFFVCRPDFGVPSSAAGLRRVLDIFEHYLSTGAGHGPPIVHCSAGLGRAGECGTRLFAKKKKKKKLFSFLVFFPLK